MRNDYTSERHPLTAASRFKDTNYYVSQDGRVFRRNKGYRHVGEHLRELTPFKMKEGYLKINTTFNGTTLIHRLVAEAFIPNPDNKPCVNHKNGIKTDNRVENLEWCTYAENNQHALDVGLYVKSAKTIRKLSSEDVLFIRKRELGIKTLAKKFNVSVDTIKNIVKGKTYKDI